MMRLKIYVLELSKNWGSLWGEREGFIVRVVGARKCQSLSDLGIGITTGPPLRVTAAVGTAYLYSVLLQAGVLKKRLSQERVFQVSVDASKL